MLDALGVAVCLRDAREPGTPLVYLNSQFEALMGWTAEEALGRTGLFLLAPDAEGPELDELRAAVAGRRPCRVTLHLQTRDGEAIWTEVTVTPLPAEGDEAVWLASVVVDVTDRVAALEAAREALRGERERTQTYLDVAGAILVLLHCSSTPTWPCTRARRAAGRPRRSTPMPHTTRSSGCRSRRGCAARSRATSSCCTTSRSCGRRAAGCTRWRRCCAGTTPGAGSCRRTRSSPPRRRWACSKRSEPGCWRR